MTAVEVCFRYRTAPGEREMAAVGHIWEVYGIRRIRFNEEAHTITVEFDATRLDEKVVAGLLRRAGIDLQEQVVSA